MNDTEQALADHAAIGDGYCSGCNRPWPCPSIERIERDAAVGRAVDRLPQGCLLGQFDGGTWGVFSVDMSELKGSGKTPAAAIAAALDQPQKTQESIVVGLVGDQMEDAT